MSQPVHSCPERAMDGCPEGKLPAAWIRPEFECALGCLLAADPFAGSSMADSWIRCSFRHSQQRPSADSGTASSSLAQNRAQPAGAWCRVRHSQQRPSAEPGTAGREMVRAKTSVPVVRWPCLTGRAVKPLCKPDRIHGRVSWSSSGLKWRGVSLYVGGNMHEARGQLCSGGAQSRQRFFFGPLAVAWIRGRRHAAPVAP